VRILVTGGAGYIGSHTCVELLEAGHEVVVIDNLANSKEEAIRRIERITCRDVSFHRVDLLDRRSVDRVFSANRLDAVIHFAGLKAVGESTAVPLRYYHNNITSTVVLCEVMAQHDVRTIVFSSSATIYGEPASVPIREDFPARPANPYGRTKWMIEQILTDLFASDPAWTVVLLRYFNPIGAHPSGLIGEDPLGIPNNLLPYIAQVAVGRLDELRIFGDDYPTQDGTGVRDYIHVVDLAQGHLAALERLAGKPGVHLYNLGTGRGYSVLEVLRAFERACGRSVPQRVVGRRPGDIAMCYADPSKANRELGWRTIFDIDDMCAHTWKWQSMNPDGY